jgi:hypothetical protein
VSQLNNYPTGVPAVGIISTLFWATLTDFLGGKRYLVGYWIGITGTITSAMILAPSATTASTFAAYYWAGSVYACKSPRYLHLLHLADIHLCQAKLPFSPGQMMLFATKKTAFVRL